MGMKRLFLYIGVLSAVLVSGVSRLQGQMSVLPDTLVFSGVVLNGQDMKPLPHATCRLDGARGCVSDEEGYFRLTVERGDTVLFTYVGFRPCRVVVPDTLDGKEYMVGVFMSPDTLQLSEALVLRRWNGMGNEALRLARNNMRGILKQAYDPNRPMDADMNQRMMIEEYARSVEMKGHVDVGFGIGTQSLEAWRMLRMQKRIREQESRLEPEELDLLKKIYYLEKRKKRIE